jgi:hypothetical protein
MNFSISLIVLLLEKFHYLKLKVFLTNLFKIRTRANSKSSGWLSKKLKATFECHDQFALKLEVKASLWNASSIKLLSMNLWLKNKKKPSAELLFKLKQFSKDCDWTKKIFDKFEKALLSSICYLILTISKSTKNFWGGH